MVDRHLGAYEIVEELGRGGMAVVYKAWQPSLERFVALKVLPEYFQHDPEFLARFHREAKSAAQLNHPNIVHVYDIGQVNGLHYIAMEYVEGSSLRERMTTAPLDLQDVQRVLVQVGDALDHAHARGLVHRDIKPGNILFTANGQAKVTDFGIARAADGTQLTRTGMILGTPEYMSPEQAEGSAVDHRSDLYALGVVLYQMLTGHIPFRGTTPHATLHAVIYEPPTPPRQANPKLSQAIESVILKAMAKQPADRFQSGRALAGAFRKALTGVTVRVPPTARQPGPASQRPIGMLVAAIAVVVLVLGALIVWMLLSQSKTDPAIETAAARAATSTALALLSETDTPPNPTDDQRLATDEAFRATQNAVEATARALDSVSATGTGQALERERVTATAQAAEQATRAAIDAATEIAVAVQQTADALATQAAQEATQTAEAQPTATATGVPAPPTNTSVPPTPTPPPPTEVPPGPQPNSAGRIVFASERDGNSEIYVMNADGSGQTRLTNHGALDSGPAWSPDGQRIAFVSERDGNREIYVMNADGSGQANLTRNPANDAYPAWAGNNRLLFESDRTGNWEIFVMNIDGSGQANLTNHPDKDTHPAWSSSGRIAFASMRDGNSEIYVMNAGGSGQTNLSHHPRGEFTPDWSSSGRIAFMSNREGNREIFVMNANGGGQTRVTNHPNHDFQPSWSPDGTRITFASERDGNLEIYVVNADGSGVTRLTNHPAQDNDPDWSP